MFLRIFLKLLLFLAVFELASAIAGHRVYGTRFSLALPRITTADGVVSTDTKYIGSLTMMTEEERSKVKIYYPMDTMKEETRYNTDLHDLKRYVSKEVFIPSKSLFPEISGTDVYNTVKITTTSPIRVVLNRYNNENHDSADSHNVMPIGSCSTSYYVSTGLGHAFLMVMTFDSTVTNVKVTFAKTGQKFKFLCYEETRCEDDSEVVLTLRKNKAWYVEQELGVRFLNTLIETDKPVFVIAGNKALKTTRKSLDDLVVTSIYPTEAWGKEYVTPWYFDEKNTNGRLVFQFNAKRLPFNFQTFDGVSKRKEVISSFDSYFTITNSRGFYIITADVPFGLYQIFGLQGQNRKRNDCVATIVNLIPTEQWSNGVVIRRPENKHHYVYKLYTTAQQKRYRVSITGSTKNTIDWKSTPMTYNQRFYFSGTIRLHSGSAVCFTNDPLARMIVYQFKQSYGYTSCSGTAVDFYQASIHRLDCKNTKKNIVASDGLDNDCDGRVDEEIKDKKDNDGDGEIDEDLVETNGKGYWTTWQDHCHFNCRGRHMKINVRSCIKTRFGHACSGKSYSESGDTFYSMECAKSRTVRKCRCNPGCGRCHSHLAVCPECRPGYYDDNFCLRPCPKGWKGKGCSQWPRTKYPARKFIVKVKVKKEKGKKKEKETTEKEPYRNSSFTPEPPRTSTVREVVEESERVLLYVLSGVASLVAVCVIGVWCLKKRHVQVKEEVVVEEEKVEEVMMADTTAVETSVDTTSIASSNWQSESSDESEV